MSGHIQLLKGLITAKKFSKKLQKNNWTTAEVWNDLVTKYGSRDCLAYVDENRSYTYAEMDERINKFANWGISIGLKTGDCVSLMKENSPEFVVVWIAMAKIGAKTALINHNLTGAPLANCLKLAAKEGSGEKNVIIYGASCEEQLKDEKVLQEIAGIGEFHFFSYENTVDGYDGEIKQEGGNTWQSLDVQLVDSPGDGIDPSLCSSKGWKDVLYYIYTSGTTGLPKAATINHTRFWTSGVAFGAFFGVNKKDVVYCPMPIYHSAGGMLGMSMILSRGGKFVMRKKFSASNYMKDCYESKATIGQYIGELCKYVNATEVSEYDTKHKLRLIMGNGLRKEDWVVFVKRFNVPNVGEFYGSTEGNATLLNTRNEPGACGWLPGLARKIYPVKIIKMQPSDEETPLRKKNGRCIQCKPGEVGQLIGLIKQNDPLRRFDGYTDEKATKKKILKDVFKKGDMWFATGDLIKLDSRGFYYFVDRIGDTFRWKGENCSTREVEEVASQASGIREVNVYGVEVEGNGGRAGMACIGLLEGQTLDGFNFDELYSVVEKSLASYQRPLFLRFPQEFENTTTFKHRKVDLRKQGFDPSATSDPLYFIDNENKTYVPLDTNLYNKIQGGEVRV